MIFKIKNKFNWNYLGVPLVVSFKSTVLHYKYYL